MNLEELVLMSCRNVFWSFVLGEILIELVGLRVGEVGLELWMTRISIVSSFVAVSRTVTDDFCFDDDD